MLLNFTKHRWRRIASFVKLKTDGRESASFVKLNIDGAELHFFRFDYILLDIELFLYDIKLLST